MYVHGSSRVVHTDIITCQMLQIRCSQIIPFLTIKRIFFATATTLTFQLPGGLKIIVLKSLWSHLL